jgi:hypothetical protein
LTVKSWTEVADDAAAMLKGAAAATGVEQSGRSERVGGW